MLQNKAHLTALIDMRTELKTFPFLVGVLSSFSTGFQIWETISGLSTGNLLFKSSEFTQDSIAF